MFKELNGRSSRTRAATRMWVKREESLKSFVQRCSTPRKQASIEFVSQFRWYRDRYGALNPPVLIQASVLSRMPAGKLNFFLLFFLYCFKLLKNIWKYFYLLGSLDEVLGIKFVKITEFLWERVNVYMYQIFVSVFRQWKFSIVLRFLFSVQILWHFGY